MLVSMRAAAIVALLALGTSLVAVQIGSLGEPVKPVATEPGGSWVTVTGTQEIIGTAGGFGAAISTVSDERISGNVAITWSAAAETTADENNDALWGTVRISNDGGTWVGQWVGFVDDQGRHHITEWFEGTGAYEGLRYIEQGVQRERGGLLDVTGLIYEGAAPSTVNLAEVME